MGCEKMPNSKAFLLPLSLKAVAAAKGGNRRGFAITKRELAVEELTDDGMWPMGFVNRRQNVDNTVVKFFCILTSLWF